MASNSEFQTVSGQARLPGIANLVRKENHLWWHTRRWWVQTLTWWVMLTGLLALFIWVVPSRGDATSETQIPPEVKCLMFFVMMAGLAPAIGVIILAQDSILNEKLSGTMAWVLTKPVSRTAFLLSKLVANAFGVLMTMVVFQGLSVYLVTYFATGTALPPLLYAGMLGILFLNLLFYLSLVVMLSTISSGRGLAIGVPLLIIFGVYIFPGIVPWIVYVMPWHLTNDIGSNPALALSVALGQPLPTWMPVIATVVWCLIFTGIALWRFHREEF